MEPDTEQGGTVRESVCRMPETVTSVDRRVPGGRVLVNLPRVGRITLQVFSGELDKLLAGLIMATTAVSLGIPIAVFLTVLVSLTY